MPSGKAVRFQDPHSPDPLGRRLGTYPPAPAARHGIASNLVFGTGGGLLGSSARGAIVNQHVLATIPQPSLEVTCRGHRSSVTGVSFQRSGAIAAAPGASSSPVAPKVVSSSMDGALTLWDAKITHRSLRNTAHHSPVLCCDCSPKALAVASGGHNGYAQLWVPNLRRTSSTYPATWSFPAANGNDDDHYQWKAHSGAARAIAFSQDGSDYVYTAGDDKAIKCWDLNYLQSSSYPHYSGSGGRQPQRGAGNRFVGSFSSPSTSTMSGIAGHTNWIHCIAVQGPQTHSSYFHLMASGGDDRCAFLWDTRTYRCVDVLREPSASVRSLSFHPTGYALACSDADGAIQIYDLRRVKGPLATLSSSSSIPQNSSAAPQSRYLSHQTGAAVTRSSHVMLQRYPTAHAGAANGVAFTPDGNWLLSVGDDGDIHVWDVLEGHLYCTVQAHNGAVKTISVSADGSYFATGGYDHTVLVWRLNLPRSSYPALIRPQQQQQRGGLRGSSRGLATSPAQWIPPREEDKEKSDSDDLAEEEEEEEEEEEPRRHSPPQSSPPRAREPPYAADMVATPVANRGVTPTTTQQGNRFFTLSQPCGKVAVTEKKKEEAEEEGLTRFRRSEERLDYPPTPVAATSPSSLPTRAAGAAPLQGGRAAAPSSSDFPAAVAAASSGVKPTLPSHSHPLSLVLQEEERAPAVFPTDQLDLLFSEQQKIREEMQELRGAMEAMASKATATAAPPPSTVPRESDDEEVRRLREDMQVMQQRQREEYHELRALLTAWMETQQEQHGSM